MCALENPNEQWSQRLPEKTPNSEANSVSDDDLEALVAEVLETPVEAPPGGEVIDADIVDEEIVDAEVVEAEALPNSAVVKSEEVNGGSEKSFLNVPPRAYAVPAGPVNFNQGKLQTKGGAVGGVLLGALSIAGSFLTIYSVINAFIGLALSLWGLNSGERKLAQIGMVLSGIGMVLSFILAVAR